MFEAFHLPVKFFHLQMPATEKAFHRQTVAERPSKIAGGFQ
jgi:hypothetical protein